MENINLEKINEILKKIGKNPVKATDDFDALGILDSIEIIDFFVSIEKMYNTKISENTISEKKLTNVSNLINYLNAL